MPLPRCARLRMPSRRASRTWAGVRAAKPARHPWLACLRPAFVVARGGRSGTQSGSCRALVFAAASDVARGGSVRTHRACCRAPEVGQRGSVRLKAMALRQALLPSLKLRAEPGLRFVRCVVLRAGSARQRLARSRQAQPCAAAAKAKAVRRRSEAQHAPSRRAKSQVLSLAALLAADANGDAGANSEQSQATAKRTPRLR